MRPRIQNRATGLGRALPTGSLLAITTGMTLLAGMALAAAVTGGTHASVWAQETGNHLMIELPGATGAPPTALAAQLAQLEGVQTVHILPPDDVAALLRPWLGTPASAPGTATSQAEFLPVVIDVTHRPDAPAELQGRIQHLAPDATIAADRPWAQRLQNLGNGVHLLSLALVAIVAGIAALVVGIAVRASLTAKRPQIEIVHELGAGPGVIVRPIARACLSLGFGGGLIGTLCAGGVLLGLATLAAPLLDGAAAQPAMLPTALVEWLAILPFLAALLCWSVAHLVVRTWLHRLP